MLNEKQLSEFFKIKHLPIKDGEFWDGKPMGYSNLKQWGLSFSQKFGQNLLNYAQFRLKGHNGLDFPFFTGCPIVAPCRLYTTYIQVDPTGYGNAVWAETETQQINGDSYKLELAFGHFKEIVAKPYRWYNEGDLLGYGDSTGFSTGSHLHFGIRPHCKLTGKDLKQMFPDNGFLGWIDPEPFLPHIVWDFEELNKKDFMTEFKEKHDNKLVQVIYKVKDDLGEEKTIQEMGWFYNNSIRIAKTDDRATLMLISYIHRNFGGITVDKETWDKLPKELF